MASDLMMVAHVVGLAIACISLIVMVYLSVKLHRPPNFIFERLISIESRVGNFDTQLGAQLSQSRGESREASRSLREEITNSFDTLSQGVRQSISDLAQGQKSQLENFARQLEGTRSQAVEDSQSLRGEVRETLTGLGNSVVQSLEKMGEQQGVKFLEVSASISKLTADNERRQEALRTTVEVGLAKIQTENGAKLDQMRETVDEKLQSTLEARIGASFTQVNESLKRVFESVGEMQALAAGVGDLKRVLTNIKSRGTWSEVSLGTLLADVLTSEQYAQNVEIEPGTNKRVEYAIRLPGTGDSDALWLPIDAKFPIEDYDRMLVATERADAEALEAASIALEAKLYKASKEISEKYIRPPYSTDFAIMFLPTEGLYAEAIRRCGLVDKLQRECRVVVAGPSTLHAVLSSLRMGFRSLAIQKRSSEVWRVLSAVKTEFGKFGSALSKVEKKLEEAKNAVVSANTRKRVMDQKLNNVEMLPETQAAQLLGVTPNNFDSDETFVDDGFVEQL
jgi:DNA recombination protein RmuC